MNIITWLKNKVFFPKSVLIKKQHTVLTVNSILDPNNTIKNSDGTTSISSECSHPLMPKSRINSLRLKETSVVDWLINNGHLQLICMELFSDLSKPIYYKPHVKEPFIVNKPPPGDLDLIIFQNPLSAVGIECKLVKTTFETDSKTKLNKISKIKDAWIQLEGYRLLGFHQTYLLLIVLDDQSLNKREGQLSRKLDEDIILNQELLQFENDSGIIILYINQFSEFDYNTHNRVSSELIRKSHKQNQPDILTEKIEKAKFETFTIKLKNNLFINSMKLIQSYVQTRFHRFLNV